MRVCKEDSCRMVCQAVTNELSRSNGFKHIPPWPERVQDVVNLVNLFTMVKFYSCACKILSPCVNNSHHYQEAIIIFCQSFSHDNVLEFISAVMGQSWFCIHHHQNTEAISVASYLPMVMFKLYCDMERWHSVFHVHRTFKSLIT